MAREKRHRGRRILIGIGVMIVVAATPFVILSHYAGGWGVPYFTFVTDRGSTCTNDFTGYHCDNLTLADIEWWGDVDLPEGTRLISSHYKSTNEFTLDALVEIPQAKQDWAKRELLHTFGSCVPGHATQLDTDTISTICVRANDESDPTTSSKPLSDTLYEVSSGYRKTNHAMVVGIHEESR